MTAVVENWSMGSSRRSQSIRVRCSGPFPAASSWCCVDWRLRIGIGRPSPAGGPSATLSHIFSIHASAALLPSRRDEATSPPRAEVASDRDFVDFINTLNAQWVTSAQRLSPRVLTDLYAQASQNIADSVESLPLEAPALFPVSWAGGRKRVEAGTVSTYRTRVHRALAPPAANPDGCRRRRARDIRGISAP